MLTMTLHSKKQLAYAGIILLGTVVSPLAFAKNDCLDGTITVKNNTGAALVVADIEYDAGTLSGGTPEGGIIASGSPSTWHVASGNSLNRTDGKIWLDVANANSDTKLKIGYTYQDIGKGCSVSFHTQSGDKLAVDGKIVKTEHQAEISIVAK